MRNCCKWRAALSWLLLITWCGAATSLSTTTSTTTSRPPSTSTTASTTAPKVEGEGQEAQAQEQVAILKQINRVNNDGSYTYGYEAADGSFKIETRDVQGTVKGMFGFVDENGQLKRVTYSASNNTGFQAGSTTSPSPSPIYRQPVSVSPSPIYRTTHSSIQSIPRVTLPSSIQSIPRVTLPRLLRRPATSTTPLPEITRRPILYLRQPHPQVTESPDENTGASVSTTSEPVIVRKVLVNRRPVVVDRTESSSLKSDEEPAKSGDHQGNALRRQLGGDRGGYGTLPSQVVRLRQAGGTDDSGDVYGGSGGGASRPITTPPYRGGFAPTRPRVVQEALYQGQAQAQGYPGVQRVPLGNFNTLDPRIQARILNSVDPRIQARILNSLDPRVQADIFRAAGEDLNINQGILQNPVDPRNPSDPRLQGGYPRGQYPDPRLRGRVPYNVATLDDPRNAVGEEDPYSDAGTSTTTSANGSYSETTDPRVLQTFLNQQDPRQQDPRLGADGYRQDPRYVSGYPQDPRLRGGYQDPRLGTGYQNPRFNGRYQDPRLGVGYNTQQDPRLGGSYFQDPRFGGSYNMDPRTMRDPQDPRLRGYAQDEMTLRIPLNPRLPFGNPRLRPANQDFDIMGQLLQLLVARAQLQRQQQLLQQQQYRQPTRNLSPFQQALLSTLEPNAPELAEQMVGPQQFPAAYPEDEVEAMYQQAYPDGYEQQRYPSQYRRRYRYRTRYQALPTYQDDDAVQYYQGPQGFANYQVPQDYTGTQGYQQQQQPQPQQQQRFRPAYQNSQGYSQPDAYAAPGQVGTEANYQALPPEYREAILLRMILASRARAQQYQDQQQSILQQSIGASTAASSASSSTTVAPTRDARTYSQVRSVQILDPVAQETTAKRSTKDEAIPKKN